MLSEMPVEGRLKEWAFKFDNETFFVFDMINRLVDAFGHYKIFMISKDFL